MVAPDGVVLDAVNNEILVPEGDKVLVFPREGRGNVAPVRVLAGPDTRIGSARQVVVDHLRDLLVVVSTPPGSRTAYEIAMFDRLARGNAKPKRVISGLPASGNVALYEKRGLIFVVLPPRVGTPLTAPTTEISYVGVWSVEDEGAVPPRYRIGGPRGVLIEPRGVTLDIKHEAVIVSDKELNAVLTFHAPEIFGGAAQQSRR